MKKSLRRIQLTYTLLSSVIILAVSFFISAFVITETNKSMKSQVSSLITADTRQLELNVNNYLNEVEKITTLLFSDEAYYAYDATDEAVTEYDRVLAADKIGERIGDLGLMQNFSDFVILYSNDETVGWISQLTRFEFASGGIYEEFASVIADNAKGEGWAYGVRGHFDRLYYVKRLNPNAIVLVSFYGNELRRAFEIPQELSEMTIRLTSQDDTILYSSESSEISSSLPYPLLKMLEGRTGISIMDDNYLVTSSQLTNGWKVICSMPTKAVLADNEKVRQKLLYFVICMVIAALLVMLLLNRLRNRSVSGMVDNLAGRASEDQMTGLLNKTAFMQDSQQCIAALDPFDDSPVICFMMFDLDNFKQVNDTLGHSKGDEVIILFSSIMKEILSEEKVRLGRIGGDEFAAFTIITDRDIEAAREFFHKKAEKIMDSFSARTADLGCSLPLSVSIGILVSGPGSGTVEELYKKTDSALYISKRNGKSRITVV